MAGFTFAPLSSRIRQKLPGGRALEASATETIIVCPAENQGMRPAVYPDGELERITGVHEFSAGLDDEVHLATRDHVEHTCTIAMRLRNVHLASGQLCNNSSLKRLTFGHSPAAPMRTRRMDETVAFCSTAAGNDYFAHFLLDDATTAILGTEWGMPVFGGSMKARTSQMFDYLSYCEVPYTEMAATYFRDLWLFTDHAQKSHRRARLQKLRDRLGDRFSGIQPANPAYIRRDTTGSQRVLENESEIEAELSKRGFNIVDPEAMTTEQVCRMLSQTSLVVGVEGSQLVHGLLNMRPGGGLLCIQPAARFNAVYRGFCNSMGLEWGFVVAEGTADRFRVPTARLLAAIDATLEVAG